MKNEQELYILWTTDNAITAEKMVLMYAGNSMLKGWWEQVTVIIWGASAQLVSTNDEIRGRIRELMLQSVSFTACKRCADTLGVTVQLENLGVEVKYWGESLTELLRSNAKILTI